MVFGDVLCFVFICGTQDIHKELGGTNCKNSVALKTLFYYAAAFDAQWREFLNHLLGPEDAIIFRTHEPCSIIDGVSFCAKAARYRYEK